jgi:catechol 2,3-dioxygenase
MSLLLWDLENRAMRVANWRRVGIIKPMSTPPFTAQAPCGVNHLVLNVRDIEVSHRFWTEMLGFVHVGTGTPGSMSKPARFYSGVRNGKLRHHDIALLEVSNAESSPTDALQALNHLAIEYPDLEAWEHQIAFLRARGVALHRRVRRGATQSIHLTDPDGTMVELVYELPREAWEADIEGALRHAEEQPIDGA